MKAVLYVHDYKPLANILAKYGGIKNLTSETRKKVKEEFKEELNEGGRTDGFRLTSKQFTEMISDIKKDSEKTISEAKKILGE